MTPSSARMASRVAVALLALVVAGCGAGGATSTTIGGVICEEPPPTDATSGLEMTLEPDPVAPREVAHLQVGGGALPADASVGVDAMWQCWDGEGWATTHVVYRGFGDNPGQTIPVNDTFQIHVPSIGLALDSGYPIVIPVVEAGVYRIADKVIHENAEFEGFVLVEVVDG